MNKLMNVIVVVSSLASFSSGVFANGESVLSAPSIISTPLKSEDTVYRQQLMHMLDTIPAFSARFSQKVSDDAGALLQELSGDITVKKPNLVNWHTKFPDENQIISDGQTLWLFDPFIEQATAYPLDTSINNTPILLLSSNDESLWQNYNIVQLSPAEYEIHSLQENSQVTKLSVSFNVNEDNQQAEISKFVIHDATGQSSEFLLTDFIVNPELSHDAFTFQVPEGVYLDDQR